MTGGLDVESLAEPPTLALFRMVVTLAGLRVVTETAGEVGTRPTEYRGKGDWNQN